MPPSLDTKPTVRPSKPKLDTSQKQSASTAITTILNPTPSPPSTTLQKQTSKTPTSAIDSKNGFFTRLRLKSDVSETKPFKPKIPRPNPPAPEPINANPPVFIPSTPLLATPYNFSLGVTIGPVLRTAALNGLTSLSPTYHHPHPSLTPGKSGVPSTSTQIRQACDNVAYVLSRIRVGATWNFVYAIRTYHADLEDSLELMAAALKARCAAKMGREMPVWVWCEVGRLGKVGEGVRVEIEVEAYLERQEGGM